MNDEQTTVTLSTPPISRLKVHLRHWSHTGTCYRVVTLRPSTPVAFSTNYYHNTWHIVSSQKGSQLLARLLWGLSYQRQPGTLVILHGQHLLPTPFDAERSDPIVLIPAGLTSIRDDTLRALKGRLDHLGPTQTIRWHTFGLDLALQRDEPSRADWLNWDETKPLWEQETMTHRGGFICYTAPAAILRERALRVHALRVRKIRDRLMDYYFLAEPPRGSFHMPDGEVQIFADYMDRVAAAVQARQECMPNPNEPIRDEETEFLVSNRRDEIKARLIQQKPRFGRNRH